MRKVSTFGGQKIWKSGKNGKFWVQRKGDGNYVVANKAGRAFRLTEEELYDFTEFLDDVCDAIEDGK